jgi:ABC-type polysaccharide/polyol phosphate export permease
MAQIRIEQKRSSLGWLWVIIALIIIGVIIWYLLGRSTAATESRNASSPSATPSSQVVPAQGALSTGLAAA